MRALWVVGLFFTLFFLSASAPAYAQEAAGECKADAFNVESGPSESAPASSASAPAAQSGVIDSRPAVSVSPTTDAEAAVQDQIKEDGLHVVHFWAPWCPNSTRELKNGWARLVADNPEVTFTFVTVWNDGESGENVLDKHNLPDRVTELTQPDLGPSDNESNRRRSFLGLPVTWIPTTWIFHQNGELAFAMNYGEMERSTIQSLLDTTEKDW